MSIGVTQPTEKPGLFADKLNAMVAQEKKRSRGKFNEEEYRIICKEALRLYALDKIEFSLRGEIRRGKHRKMGLSEAEFTEVWRSKMKERLQKDGYFFELTKEEQETLAKAKEAQTKKKMEEATNMAAEALKKVILTV